MRHAVRFTLLSAIALSIACVPGPAPSDEPGSPSTAKPEEKPVDPTSDIEKDEVNLENLGKPLIENPK